MKDFKFRSSPKLDSMIKSILANSKFSSAQEYLEWRINQDYATISKKKSLG
jgi:hypothetical protein